MFPSGFSDGNHFCYVRKTVKCTNQFASSLSLGSTMLRSTASNVATTTGDLPKIITNQSGKLARESLACEIPIPSAAASPTMEVLRNVIFCDVISFIPVMAMDAKTDTVAPPSTQYGIVVKETRISGSLRLSTESVPHRRVHSG